MFRELFSAFSKETAIDRAFSELNVMLEEGAWMFVRANDVLHGRVSADEAVGAIDERERKINRLERSIRRKVLRHLTINPGHDVPVCLALVSVARDAERIGDYCKNVFEVGHCYDRGFHVPAYHDPLEKVSSETLEMFRMVGAACRDATRQDEARKAKDRSGSIREQCDQVIEQLFREEHEIEFHEAVAYSLLARHYKRVAAHLTNIATAVLGEWSELDVDFDDA